MPVIFVQPRVRSPACLVVLTLVNIQSCREYCRPLEEPGCSSYSPVISKMTPCVDSECRTTVMPGGGIWAGGSQSAVQVSACEFCRPSPVHRASAEPWRLGENRSGCAEIPSEPAPRLHSGRP